MFDHTQALLTTSNNNLFNGKELQHNEFGYNNGLEVYDFGARLYEPQIGRWTAVDPMAAKAPNWSPYRAFYDNPTYWTDPTGLWETDEMGNQSTTDASEIKRFTEMVASETKLTTESASDFADAETKESGSGKLSNGSIVEASNLDAIVSGDMFYDKSRETDAYKYMNIVSNKLQREVGAFITPDGIYIPDSRKNSFGRCPSITNTKVIFVNGLPTITYNANTYNVIGILHTHPQFPNGNPDQGLSDADWRNAEYYKVPFFSMAADGNVDAVHYKNNTLYYYPTRGITTQGLMNGNISLINRLK